MTRYIIDVREPEEYATGHIENAVNIPLAELMEGSSKLDNLDKDTELVLYCRSGNRSNVGLQSLRTQGFTNLKNGINEQYVKAHFL